MDKKYLSIRYFPLFAVKHPIRRKLLELAQLHKIDNLTLREIGDLIGVSHPQIVKHHLDMFLRADAQFSLTDEEKEQILTALPHLLEAKTENDENRFWDVIIKIKQGNKKPRKINL